MMFAHGKEKGFKETRLATWEKIKKRTGKKIDFLDNRPVCPYEMLYLWDIYNGLLKGCERIGFVEIESYQQIYDIKLQHWEADLMIDIDLMRRKKLND